MSEHFGVWANRIFHSEVARRYDHPTEFMDLLCRAYPSVGFGPAEWESRSKATLWVPIDLRGNLQSQLNGLEDELRPVREDLLRLTGRKRTRPVDPEVAWRNLYCHMLATRGKNGTRQIADEVFPGEKSGVAKVRKILSDFRSRLR